MRSEGQDLPELKLVGTLPSEAAACVADDPGICSLPHQSEATLIDLVRRARALLLPSEIEGFGLPALEAYFLGTPVCYAAESVAEILAGRTP